MKGRNLPQERALPSSGRRERNKQDKQARLKAAARALFTTRGYDQATTRDIARAAGIGMGTLFTYARDKRDLLFLIFNDELEALAGAGFRDVPEQAPLATQLAGFFAPFYDFFAGQPDLARFMLRELEFYQSGPQAQRFRAARELLLVQLASRLGDWQRAGRIAADASVQDGARAVLALFAALVRDALEQPAPDMAASLATLERLYAMLLRGLARDA